MKKAGEMLKTARESKKLSLHEIGMALKINPKILQAIEDADIEKLPQKTFLRGFIKSYAQYLKLDGGEILKIAEMTTPSAPLSMPGATEAVETATPVTPTAASVLAAAASARPARLENLRTPAPAPRRGLHLALIVILFALIVIVVQMVNKYQREKAPAPTGTNLAKSTADSGLSTGLTNGGSSPDLPSVTPTVVPVPPLEPANLATKPAVEVSTATAPASPVVTPTPAEPTKSPVSAPTAPVANGTATVKSAETAHAPIVKENSAAATPTKTTPKTADAPQKSTKPQEVIVEALNPVKINYHLGDGQVQSLDLNADEVHTFKSKTAVHIEISDGGSINVIVNGRDRGVPGKIGKPLTLNYPK